MSEQILSIVMLVHNRPRLTRQALESLQVNTHGPFNLTVVDDGSTPENSLRLVEQLEEWPKSRRARLLRYTQALGPGRARNEGISASLHYFGKPGLLYLCDNDMFALPGWDETLLKCWNAPERVQERFWALGGYCHPFQQRGRLISNPGAMAGHSIAELEALGLLSWLMAWETWDKFGPFEPSPTINYSEDWALSQRIRKASGRVGVVEPALVINTGVTSSDGRACPGAALLYDQDISPGVVLE